MKNVKLMLGDNMESLKKLPDNSVDSIVSDPPYGLSFMNRKWDYDVPSIEFWKEVYRVLKPGGHVLSFGGSRTYHRMAVNIEDAGFEIRDQIQWLYSTGFPKSHNISKKIEQEIDNLIYNNIWKSKLNNVKIVEETLKKSQIEVGNNMEKLSSVQESVVEKIKEKLNNQNVIAVEKNSTEVYHILKENHIVQENVGQFIIQQQELVKCVEQLNEDQIVKLLNTFIVEENVKDMLKESSMDKIKVEEVLRILNGEEKFSVLEIIPVLCVILPKILKHIILNQSKIFQNLDTKSQMDYVSVTSVIITKSIMEHLIGNTVNILRRRIDFTIDTGHTALKPANEPICVARKPLSEKTIAENVIKWGTGGINIDGCRIGTDIIKSMGTEGKQKFRVGDNNKVVELGTHEGRFPANIILDETAAELLDLQSGISKSIKSKRGGAVDSNSKTYNWNNGDEKVIDKYECGFTDKGGASRFFYVAKVSKKERNLGLDSFEEKETNATNQNWRCIKCSKFQLSGNGDICKCDEPEWKAPINKNTHPTLKPINLMTYLCRLVTPEGGIVLDPFMGSGSTGISALLEGFRFIGMEQDKSYFDIASARIEAYEEYRKLLK